MKTICPICPHHCKLEPGQIGLCRGRINKGDEIVCENYGKLTALALDPIEKKPLARFFPGSLILSTGSYGCNLACPFCQNHHISMAAAGDIDTVYLSPEALAEKALSLADRGTIGIAYTYNEPLIGYEYVRDCAKCVREKGMKNVLVTNGYVEEEPLSEILPLIDALNIDLKAFTDALYRKWGGDLETVKRTIRQAAQITHVEVTTLIIPGENDSEEEMTALSSWLSGLDMDIPLHISRFFPRHHYSDGFPTPADTIYHLAKVARRFLPYVYSGNC